MTISWVNQVATDPKLVGISVESTSVTHALLVDEGIFALSILPREARALVRRFAKPVTDVSIDEATLEGTMEGERVHGASTGAPVLDAAVAWLDCEVRHVLAMGSHSLFVGEVVDCGEASPLYGRGGADPSAPDGADAVLRMEDTRMNYGG
jgi:flavin reductase (DIM6/NTAB) family NADH-FMN oxidoreductase RutF